jgi:hypothetical protein
MRNRLAGALLLTFALTATAARGEELPTRFEAGVRAGLGFPIGNAIGPTANASNGTSLADLVAWTVPLQLELGARIGPVFVGGYGSYAFGKAGSLFEGASSRSASDVRIGFEVLWHLSPDRKVDPWVGIGVGYEWLNLGVQVGTFATVNATFRGFEWVNAQLGIEFVLGRHFGLGPFIQASVAQYDSGSGELITSRGTRGGSADIQSKAVHAWIGVGLRFAFLL